MCIINDIVNGIVIQTSCACLYKYLNRFNLLSLPRYGCHELNRNVKCNIIALKGSVLHVLLSRIYCITTNENWNIILYFISDYIVSINTNWICNIKMLFKSTYERLSNSILPCFWPFYQIKGDWEKSGRGENLVLRKCENRGNTADCATSPSLIVLLLANRQTGRDYIEVSQRQERKCISHKTWLGKVKDAFFSRKEEYMKTRCKYPVWLSVIVLLWTKFQKLKSTFAVTVMNLKRGDNLARS